ncbi:MAG: imelysin family protein [Pseudomonadota bacterium]
MRSGLFSKHGAATGGDPWFGRAVGVALAVFLLASCGGGGGGSSTPAPPPPANPPPSDPLGAVQDNATEQRRLYEVVADLLLTPDHAGFAMAAAALADSMAALCADPATATTADTQTAWADAMSAWQRIQWLRTGPVEQDNRRLRIQFFPDENDAVTNGIDNLLADTTPVDEARISNINVGAQGLPALEYLLFELGGFDDGITAPRRCEVGEAVTANLVTMANELDEEWRTGGTNREDFINGGGRFIDGDGVLIEILESFAVQAEFMADRKMGDAIRTGLADRLESFRSATSGDALVTNLQVFSTLLDDTVDDTYRLNDYLERVHSAGSVTAELSTQVDTALSAAEALGVTFEDILNGVENGDLEPIRQALQRLADAVEDAAISAGVTIGFNNLDGD